MSAELKLKEAKGWSYDLIGIKYWAFLMTGA